MGSNNSDKVSAQLAGTFEETGYSTTGTSNVSAQLTSREMQRNPTTSDYSPSRDPPSSTAKKRGRLWCHIEIPNLPSTPAMTPERYGIIIERSRQHLSSKEPEGRTRTTTLPLKHFFNALVVDALEPSMHTIQAHLFHHEGSNKPVLTIYKYLALLDDHHGGA